MTTLFQVALLLATILCSLVAGFLFAFAAVVMPGIRSLDDGGFIRSFQAIDRVIQNNQPLFILVWVGSVPAIIAAAVLGLLTLDGVDRLIVVGAALSYVLCVQAPTVVVNIPLNNELQRLDVATMNDAARRDARTKFEARWNTWNAIRAACASVVGITLMLLLLRL